MYLFIYKGCGAGGTALSYMTTAVRIDTTGQPVLSLG